MKTGDCFKCSRIAPLPARNTAKCFGKNDEDCPGATNAASEMPAASKMIFFIRIGLNCRKSHIERDYATAKEFIEM